MMISLYGLATGKCGVTESLAPKTPRFIVHPPSRLHRWLTRFATTHIYIQPRHFALHSSTEVLARSMLDYYGIARCRCASALVFDRRSPCILRTCM